MNEVFMSVMSVSVGLDGIEEMYKNVSKVFMRHMFCIFSKLKATPD